MTWFDRDKEFVEEADILADDFEAEFDNIADALNGLLVSGLLAAESNKSFGSGESSWADASHKIAGTEKTISVARPSILRVEAVFDFHLQVLNGEDPELVGTLAVDKTAQTRLAKLRRSKGSSGSSEYLEATVAQCYAVELAAGNHTIALYAKTEFGHGSSGLAQVKATHTCLSYLLIPDPEP